MQVLTPTAFFFLFKLINDTKNADLLGKLFFLKRLEVIVSFFNSCRLTTLSLKGIHNNIIKQTFFDISLVNVQNLVNSNNLLYLS